MNPFVVFLGIIFFSLATVSCSSIVESKRSQNQQSIVEIEGAIQSLQQALTNNVDHTPQQAIGSNIFHEPLYSNLDRLACGIPLRIAMCQRFIVLQPDKPLEENDLKNEDYGITVLSGLDNGNVIILVSTTRPNRTTIVSINAALECKLIFDSFKLDSSLANCDITIGYIGNVMYAGNNSFILTEQQNILSEELTDHPRRFILHIWKDDGKIQVLDKSHK